MKALLYILVLVLLTMGSCTSSLYTGAEYDDLYYLASDKPVVTAKLPVNEQIAAGNLNAEDYYDNIYAADTLVSDEYSDAVDYDDQIIINNNNYTAGYDYFNNYSYAGRLRRFYGNYFDPYWRDPFGYGFGYGGFPNSFNFYDPYYGYGGNNFGFWDDYYGGFYGGGYGGYYGSGYGGYYGGGYGGYYGGFGSYYSPFYSPYGYYSGSNFHSEGKNSVSYGRTERPSTLSSRWNNNVSALGSSRRDSYLSTGGNSGVARRLPAGSSGNQTISPDTRRTVSTSVNSQQAVNPADRKLSQETVKGENVRTNTSTQRNSANTRPEYNSVNRSYTPSYNNPRMSTRPSYNNSRVSDVNNASVIRNNGAVNNNRVYNNTGNVRTPSNQGSYQNPANNSRNNTSGNGTQRRVDSPSVYSAPASGNRSNSSGSSESYSVPTRRSVESRSYSPGSYNNSSSGNVSSGSSYSSGSSSGASSGSSCGSSSGSSSSSSSSSSSGSSSGRR